jgi:hypothetical protein
MAAAAVAGVARNLVVRQRDIWAFRVPVELLPGIRVSQLVDIRVECEFRLVAIVDQPDGDGAEKRLK